MKIPGEYFEQFFEDLVGTPEAAADFQANLVNHMAEESDPYKGLRVGALCAVETTIKPYQAQAKAADNFEAFKKWEKIRTNGRTGVRITVSALKGLGATYTRHATVPQAEKLVEQTTDRVLKHIFSIACTDRWAAGKTIGSNRTGLSPRNPLLWPVVLFDLSHTFPYGRALRATQGPDGQLGIAIRHKKHAALNRNRCPAVDARIVNEDARQQSAMLKFMSAIGSVAVTEIYPKQFEIIPAP